MHLQAGSWVWGHEVEKVELCYIIKWGDLFNGRGWGKRAKKEAEGERRVKMVGRTLKKAMKSII